jgi:hypothetical protein
VLAQTLTQYYHFRYRLILTSTPLQNNVPELLALLNFVLPKIFNSAKSLNEGFNTSFANSGVESDHGEECRRGYEKWRGGRQKGSRWFYLVYNATTLTAYIYRP